MVTQNQLTYMHLLTPLHTGGSADEGNLMGIAREVHTEFPYLPASSLRGKIRSELERQDVIKDAVGDFFGQKIKDGNQPTEGEVWFADATLLFFPVASLSHHLIWMTCPLWIERWSRWLDQAQQINLSNYRTLLKTKSALTTFEAKQLYLQTAVISAEMLHQIEAIDIAQIAEIYQTTGLPSFILDRLVMVNDEDCISLVETGLQREVKIAIDDQSKTVQGGSFRAEESIPPEAILFFPWGIKAPKTSSEQRTQVTSALNTILTDRLQFGGLEGLGRGWAKLSKSTV